MQFAFRESYNQYLSQRNLIPVSLVKHFRWQKRVAYSNVNSLMEIKISMFTKYDLLEKKIEMHIVQKLIRTIFFFHFHIFISLNYHDEKFKEYLEKCI